MKKQRIIPWEKVTLANKYMFYRVMTTNPDLCRRFIEHLLHIQIERIEQPAGEHTIDTAPNTHGIRLDVFVKGGNKVFDLEMQIADEHNLPQRARYYQGIMDETELKPSQNYNTLKESYVMFVCLFDPFKRGLPVYTFRNCCQEDSSIFLGDKTWKVFYNVKDWKKLLDKEEQAIFRFILDGKARSDFTSALKSQVRIACTSPQERQMFLTWERVKLEARDFGREEGLVEGEKIGKRKANKQIASRLKKAGVDIAIIADATGLSAEKIARL